jgi:hypothetical protein
MSMLYPAYENYLVVTAEKIVDNHLGIFESPISIISTILFNDVKQHHAMAFDIVCGMREDGRIEFNKSFDDAAERVYNNVIENRKFKS